VLLYDLTSTYFESDADFDPEDKRQFGYSRDKRSHCVQVVIALVVTPEYEVLAGNTANKTTLRAFLQKIVPSQAVVFGSASLDWSIRGIGKVDSTSAQGLIWQNSQKRRGRFLETQHVSPRHSVPLIHSIVRRILNHCLPTHLQPA
jgi:hypothetical protein